MPCPKTNNTRMLKKTPVRSARGVVAVRWPAVVEWERADVDEVLVQAKGQRDHRWAADLGEAAALADRILKPRPQPYL